MGARRHRNKHQDQPLAGSSVSGSRKRDTAAPEVVPAESLQDHSLDAIFDPSHIRLKSVMQRQSELVTLAWHFAVSSIFVPVAGIVLGLLAVLFAREAQDMFDLVGGSRFDRRRAQKSLVIGGVMTGIWLIGTIVLMFVLTSHGV